MTPAAHPHASAALEPRIAGDGVAADYAAALLASRGLPVARVAGASEPHPALAWARSGAMDLTGRADGPPLPAPGPLAACANGAALALAALSPRTADCVPEGAALLGERAACFGLRRRGDISPGGSCRLLRAADGWLAVNLARPEDRALLPAWLGEGDASDAWSFAAQCVAARGAAEVVERARLLGLAAAVAVAPDAAPPPWVRVAARGPRADAPRAGAPLVVDLGALWAGPLCAQLLAAAGAAVVKLESTGRPDGARAGPVFFDLLNAGKRSVALDFACADGRARLARLLARADIVVESARPRALAQLGIRAESLLAQRPGLTWVSITGHGRAAPQGNWVAFGDDAGVAAGLSLAVRPGAAGPPLFCGDAIADPLTGLHAAVAALASWRSGGGELLDLSLRDVTAHALAFPQPAEPVSVRALGQGFEVLVAGRRAPVEPPRARRARGRARPFGADTAAVLAERAGPC